MSTIAHLTLAEYDRMVACGVFDRSPGRRLEFIRGEIREMTPIGSEHEVLVDRLTEWSFQAVPRGRVWVRVQNSIGLPALESAPEPDLAWVVRRDYTRGRPSSSDVLLVIEVSETSLSYDQGDKADLYAGAGIADYWVVNIPDRAVEVRRDPRSGRYQNLQVYRGDDVIRPLALPEATLIASTLWFSWGASA